MAIAVGMMHTGIVTFHLGHILIIPFQASSITLWAGDRLEIQPGLAE
jgi:hypothetical protein